MTELEIEQLRLSMTDGLDDQTSAEAAAIVDDTPVDEGACQKLCDLINKVFKDTETIQRFKESVRNHLEMFCRAEYKSGKSLDEYLHGMSSGNYGQIFSQLSGQLTPLIAEIAKEKSPDFETHPQDGIDFKYLDVEGDFKLGFQPDAEATVWTGNKFPKKGFMVLVKIQLDYLCSMRDIRVVGVFCGVIHKKYVTVKETENLDRTNIMIANEYFDHLHVIVGDKVKKNKWVSVQMMPTDLENSPLDLWEKRQNMEPNQIYTENCLETMKRMKDGTIDLTVTSPPYDDLRTYNGYSFPFEAIAKELYRVTKDGGVIVWVVGDSIRNGSETGTSFRQALYFMEVGFNLHDTMLYKKTGMRFPEKMRYAQIFEYMFVFSKGIPKTVHIIKDRPNRWAGYTNWGQNSTRDSKGNLIKEKKDKDGNVIPVKDCKRYKKWGARTNLWEYSNGFGFGTKDKDSYKHPATFPEQLVEDHIMSWTNEGDTVYDPFMGSGTTAKMAILTNRIYIGSEISGEYVAGALHRLKGVEALRGSRLPILKAEEAKRLAEEDEHLKAVEEEVGKVAKKGKKWQPKQPEKD